MPWSISPTRKASRDKSSPWMAVSTSPGKRLICSRSVGARQPTDREFDLAVGKFAPEFDLGHVGGLRVEIEPFRRLGARLEARHGESLAPPKVRRRTLRRYQRPCCG